MTTTQFADPFAGADKHPAVSFKNKPIGTTITGKVLTLPKLVQGRDFDTGEPDFWPDGNPKMCVVIELSIRGETYSLWAAKPSALFAACAAAQTVAGVPIAIGGTLAITFTGETPNPAKPKLNPQKQYTVVYTPPDAFAASTPEADAEPPF